MFQGTEFRKGRSYSFQFNHLFENDDLDYQPINEREAVVLELRSITPATTITGVKGSNTPLTMAAFFQSVCCLGPLVMVGSFSNRKNNK